MLRGEGYGRREGEAGSAGARNGNLKDREVWRGSCGEERDERGRGVSGEEVEGVEGHDRRKYIGEISPRTLRKR